MAKDYESLLQEIGNALGATLEAGEQDSCTLFFDNRTWRVNLDMLPNNRDLLLAIEIKDIAPGKYRELLLKAAMVFNSKEGSSQRLAYSEPQNSLVLFQIVPLRHINAQIVQDLIGQLRKTAETWRDAMVRGITPELTVESSQSKGGSGMFGL